MEKKQWIPVIIVLFIVLAGMIGLIRQNNHLITILIGIVGIVVVGIFVRWFFFRDKNQNKQLLQATSPQPLIDYYNEMLDKVPEVYLAFPKSLAYTLYGYFDAAKLEIDRIDYRQKPQPPVFQAQKVYLQAL